MLSQPEQPQYRSQLQEVDNLSRAQLLSPLTESQQGPGEP